MIPLSVSEISALDGFCDEDGRAGIGYSCSWIASRDLFHIWKWAPVVTTRNMCFVTAWLLPQVTWDIASPPTSLSPWVSPRETWWRVSLLKMNIALQHRWMGKICSICLFHFCVWSKNHFNICYQKGSCMDFENHYYALWQWKSIFCLMTMMH